MSGEFSSRGRTEDAVALGDAPFEAASKHSGADAPLVVIYSGMKVGSITVEQAIRTRNPQAAIERLHWLADESLQDFKDTIDFSSGAGEVFQSFRYQVQLAEALRQKLKRTKTATVIVGFRDPLDHAISAFFQNVGFFCPSVTYEQSMLETATAEVLGVFEAEFAAVLERAEIGARAATMREHLADLKLGGIHRWFATEFKNFSGIDIYEHCIGQSDLIRFSARRCDFLLYRFEAIPHLLPSLLKILGLPCDGPFQSMNVGLDKPYGLIYRRFREVFKPTDKMIAYYYGHNPWGRYFDHFYPGCTRRFT